MIEWGAVTALVLVFERVLHEVELVHVRTESFTRR